MSQTFKSLIGNYKGNLKIAEQTFSDERISTKILQSSTFIKLIFFNCSFHKVNFSGSSFAKCEFHGCTFSEAILKRVEFESCRFHNCKMIESDFEEINSYDACAIIVDSQISKFNRSIDLKGDFSFDELLKFLKSIPAS